MQSKLPVRHGLRPVMANDLRGRTARRNGRRTADVVRAGDCPSLTGYRVYLVLRPGLKTWSKQLLKVLGRGIATHHISVSRAIRDIVQEHTQRHDWVAEMPVERFKRSGFQSTFIANTVDFQHPHLFDDM